MTLKTNFCPDCGKRNSDIHTCSPAYAVEKAAASISLAEQIKQARSAKGWSQRDLAQHLNVSQQTVAHWEQGGIPRMHKLKALSEMLNVSLAVTPPAAQPASRLVSHAELAQASKRYDTPYAAQRQPLTDEEIRELSSEVPLYDISASDLRQFARAIEQAHGIKERA